MYLSLIAVALLLLAGTDSRDSGTHPKAFVDPRINGGSMLDDGLLLCIILQNNIISKFDQRGLAVVNH
jgi:hypothetical protein